MINTRQIPFNDFNYNLPKIIYSVAGIHMNIQVNHVTMIKCQKIIHSSDAADEYITWRWYNSVILPLKKCMICIAYTICNKLIGTNLTCQRKSKIWGIMFSGNLGTVFEQ